MRISKKDIKLAAEKKYPDKDRSKYQYGCLESLREGYIQGRIEERAKGNWTDEDMLKAYWGGIEGSMNDYSETTRVGSELIGIKGGGGAKQWLEQYKKQKDQ